MRNRRLVICEECGDERWANVYNGRVMPRYCKYCAPRHSMHYKGGRRVRDGYVYQKMAPDYRYYSMATSQGLICEHRMVMAQHLGRPLESWEIVHHKNAVRDDNRLENLELLPSRADHVPSMQMQSKIVRQQKEIIKWQRMTVWLLQQLMTSRKSIDTQT